MSEDKPDTHQGEDAHLKYIQALQERRCEECDLLLKSLKQQLPQMKALLEEMSSHWGYEDAIYRFYHQSFKVYRLQNSTLKIVGALRELAPHLKLNTWFEQIIAEGTGKVFDVSHNEDWLRRTRPIVEAFFHARFMLEMATRYADLPEPPQTLPSGWAALLYLYNLR
jgi:hypothetical protein